MDSLSQEINNREEDIKEGKNKQLENAITTQLEEIRNQAILVGVQAACSVIQNKIAVAFNNPKKITFASLKRLIKDITKFCVTSTTKNINADGTVTNDDTELDPAIKKIIGEEQHESLSEQN